MSKKLNCWEFHNCGREKNGIMVPLLGECPVSSKMKFDGHNGGVAAGRACWMVASQTCLKNKTGKKHTCSDCLFYKRVVHEQENNTVHRFTSITV